MRALINYKDGEKLEHERAFLSGIQDLMGLAEHSVHEIKSFGFAYYRAPHIRIYVEIADGLYWLPTDTPSYRADNTHELIPMEGEKRKGRMSAEYWTSVLSEPMMLRIVKIHTKKLEVQSERG